MLDVYPPSEVTCPPAYLANKRKKGPAAPVQALCGTFTPTACINFSKLTRFNTRLRVDEARYGEAKAHLRL